MRYIPLSLLLLSLLLTSSLPALAFDSMDNAMRRQAESGYRIAQKNYRRSVENYGQQLEGLPDDERGEYCRQIRSALVDNRHQLIRESIFNTPKLEKQIQELERFASEYGCPQ